MDELAKAVQKKYIEDITKKYPLHRFLVMFMVIISSYIYSKGNDVRVLSELQNIKLSFLFDFNKGLLASVNFEQLVIAIFISGIIGYIYSKVSSMSFNLLTKLSSFDSYITQIREKVDSKKSQEEVLNYFLAKDISKELEGLRVKLKSFHTHSELFLVTALIIGWGFGSNNYFDWFLVLMFMVMIFINIWKAFQFYISDFLPYYITEQTLLGATVEFGDK
ncbi:hypothetical protein [Photobacterium damselae]|uniref:Uncharacterized protein n=2 Tax=Photobacterium damselae TaxID=38293 RepID=D0YY37_PHODD|nr:hypothetical protein [Photobacterium damselae]EEZ41168.1 hypothetical protein VDA_002200 [Photobacterium damselae subsp. damselae CIP 102761]PSW86070.1 hypothetical protein CTN07_07450 [Photobacterium damselae]SPY28087.1 Uncharacterised protein [Photobacterium damselae]